MDQGNWLFIHGSCSVGTLTVMKVGRYNFQTFMVEKRAVSAF